MASFVSPDEFVNVCRPFINVSHETFMRLKVYESVLREWQSKINLISPTTLPELWRRHFLDSAQTIQYLGSAKQLLDVGSGGGFPGLVISILTDCSVTIVESDQRKCAFLNEVVRQTGAKATILNQRIEAVDPNLVPAECVTARAFAPLSKLFSLLSPWLIAGARGVFPKGRLLPDEIRVAEADWIFTNHSYPSLSDAAASILVVDGLIAR